MLTMQRKKETEKVDLCQSQDMTLLSFNVSKGRKTVICSKQNSKMSVLILLVFCLKLKSMILE